MGDKLTATECPLIFTGGFSFNGKVFTWNIDAGGTVSDGSTNSASSSEAKGWCILVVDTSVRFDRSECHIIATEAPEHETEAKSKYETGRYK